MSKHVSYRYDFESIVAGIFRLINSPQLLKKYREFLETDFFYYNDASEDRVALREIIRILVEQSKGKNADSMSIEYLESKLPVILVDEKTSTRLLGSFRSWRANGRITQLMADDGVFELFLSYLKVLQVAKVTKSFSDKYQSGDIDSAMEIMSGAIQKAGDIGQAFVDRLSSSDITEMLGREDKYTAEALHPFSDPDPNSKVRHPLDIIVGGFQKQTLNLFISTTNGGKSAMCHHLIEACLRRKMKVWVACVEDSKRSFIYKVIANMAGVRISDLRKGTRSFSSDVTNRIDKAKQLISDYLEVQFIYGKSIDEVHKMALEYDAQCAMGGVSKPMVNIIDYTGHIASKSQGDKMHEKYRNAFGARKDFALANDKICFDFAQVNREGTKNLHADKELTQADLAGAYDLSQVCDNIISINRGASDITNETCRLHLAKARDGMAGMTVRVGTNFFEASYVMEKFDFPHGMPSGVEYEIKRSNS